jgi:hypothetical protein
MSRLASLELYRHNGDSIDITRSIPGKKWAKRSEFCQFLKPSTVMVVHEVIFSEVINFHKHLKKWYLFQSSRWNLQFENHFHTCRIKTNNLHSVWSSMNSFHFYSLHHGMISPDFHCFLHFLFLSSIDWSFGWIVLCLMQISSSVEALGWLYFAQSRSFSSITPDRLRLLFLYQLQM